MKKLKTLLLIVSVLTAIPSFAKDVQVSVNGMVCSFCAQGIKKHFSEDPAVDSVKVSLEKKLVTLSLKDGKDLSDEKITQTLKDAGYSVQKITR
jgi:mercuric ion binding protein